MSLADSKAALAQYSVLDAPVQPTLGNRLEVAGKYQHLTNESFANGYGDLRLTRKIGSEWAVFGASTIENQSSVIDTRLTAGAVRKFGFTKTFWASFTGSPDAELVAQREFDIGGDFFLGTRVKQEFSYRNRRYSENMSLHLITSNTLFILTPHVLVGGEYIGSTVTEYQVSSTGVGYVVLIPNSFLELILTGGFGVEHYVARTSVEAARGSDTVMLSTQALLTLSSTKGLMLQYQFLDRIDEYGTNEVMAKFYIDF